MYPMQESHPSRRGFVKQSAAAMAALTATTQREIAAHAFAGGGETLRVGLVGCGGRIRSGQPIHDGASAAHSTLLAIMGRMAAYTGKVITWEMALNSKESLGPARYEWGDAPDRHRRPPG